MSRWVIIGLFCFVCGCNHKHEREIRRIDSLKNIAIHLGDTLTSEAIKKATRTYYLTDSIIKTIDSNVIVKKNDLFIYKSLNRRLKEIVKNTDKHKISINFTSKQLNDLRYDVSQELIKPEQISKYLNQEIKAINDLQQDISQDFIKLEKYLSCYDTIFHKVERF